MKLNHGIKRFGRTVLLGFLAASALASAATDDGVVTVGRAFDGFCGPGGGLQYTGYNATFGAGSYSRPNLTGGGTVLTIADFAQPFCGVNLTFLRVEFPADPGRNWLTSIRCNGVTLTPNQSYWFTEGVAWWSWSNPHFGFAPLRDGTKVSCSIVHN